MDQGLHASSMLLCTATTHVHGMNPSARPTAQRKARGQLTQAGTDSPGALGAARANLLCACGGGAARLLGSGRGPACVQGMNRKKLHRAWGV